MDSDDPPITLQSAASALVTSLHPILDGPPSAELLPSVIAAIRTAWEGFCGEAGIVSETVLDLRAELAAAQEELDEANRQLRAQRLA